MKLSILLGGGVVTATAIAAAQLNAGGGAAAVIGPDVIYSDCVAISNFGAIGGIRGYALGSYTCNIGDENLLWGSQHNGTPVLGMNAYRLHEGRLMQIGMSWAKNATGAAAGNGCDLVCNGQGGSVLGVGCRDIYSSGFNGIHGILQARSEINAFTGAMPAAPGGNGDEIFRRLQIDESDLTGANFPNALYFIEGVYVGTDDAAAGNARNNASYKQVTVGAGFDLNVTGSMFQQVPAINAWYDHGNGVNMPDETVKLATASVPGEGLFHAGARVSDNGDGTWHYEYAVFNLNSHRSGGGFSVPVPAGATVSNMGFHDVDYHSGEIYDNTDWNMSVGATSAHWSSPQSHAQNANANALRWGTMYNFWFDSNAAPGLGQVTIELFIPGTPDSVTAALPAPTIVSACPWDCADQNGMVDTVDFLELLAQWGSFGSCDFKGNGVDTVDFLELLANWGPCP